ncbi:Serine/threonine-protein kinase rio2 [Chlorella vulgaris]
MKLDTNALRYLTKEDFRVLTAVEMGQKNHEIVPSSLVDTIAGLKHGGTFKCLKLLLRNKLVHHDNSKYDGYRLTYLGYDYLAIKALVNRGVISSVGRQIGVGKESDIFEVMNDEGQVMALKLHRLGRTSFRAVKSKRDYLQKGSHFSWLYLSRLAAVKEFAFMKALADHALSVPQAMLMTLVRELGNPRRVYTQLMEMLGTLAGLGLVHCDFNEFNVLISDTEELTLIDFPQMVSVAHPNARELFERDVECVVRFFTKKLGYVPERDEALEVIRPGFQEVVAVALSNVDQQLRASGFRLEHQNVLERFLDTSVGGGLGSKAARSEDDSSLEEAGMHGVDGSSSSSSSRGEHATTHLAGDVALASAAMQDGVIEEERGSHMSVSAISSGMHLTASRNLGLQRQQHATAVLGAQQRRLGRPGMIGSSRNANKNSNAGGRLGSST